MSSLVQLNNTGDDYVLYVTQTYAPFDTQVRGALQTAHAFTLLSLGIVSPMDVIQRSATISQFPINLGGSVRPAKKPDLGFVYPRRLA